jgi:hypothetical protein
MKANRIEAICRIASIIFMWVLGILFMLHTGETKDYAMCDDALTIMCMFISITFLSLGLYATIKEIERVAK